MCNSFSKLASEAARLHAEQAADPKLAAMSTPSEEVLDRRRYTSILTDQNSVSEVGRSSNPKDGRVPQDQIEAVPGGSSAKIVVSGIGLQANGVRPRLLGRRSGRSEKRILWEAQARSRSLSRSR